MANKVLDQEGLKILWAKIKTYAIGADTLKNYKTAAELVEILNNYETKDELAEALKDYATQEELDEAVEKISKVYTFKGSVEGSSDLPAADSENPPAVGDTYNVTKDDEENGLKAGDNIVWNGESWEVISDSIIDLSAYATKEYVDSVVGDQVISLTEDEIDEICV